VLSGVRGGGAAAPPRLEKFRASSSFSKILKDKKYFNRVTNSRANSVFQGKRRLFKNPGCEATFNTVKIFRANSVFQGKRRLLNSE